MTTDTDNLSLAQRKFFKFIAFINEDDEQIFYIIEQSMPSALGQLSQLDLIEYNYIIGREISADDARSVTVTENNKKIKLADADFGAIYSNLI